MEQLKKMTIRTTVAGVSQFYALCVELLVSADSLDQLVAALVVKELVLRIGRYGNPLMVADSAAKIVLSPAEAMAVRQLILSENLPPSMMDISRKVLAIIDPQLPVLERLVRQPQAALPPEPPIDDLA